MPGAHAEGSHGSPGPTIVVGYDGSASSRAAVAAAAHRAGPLGRVFVVCAFDTSSEAFWHGDEKQQLLAEQERVRELLAPLEEGAVPALLNTRWEAEVLEGHPADAIIRVAEVRGADEIYLGSRGTGRAKALLGSASHDVIHRADRPVTVIPERAVDRVTANVAT